MKEQYQFSGPYLDNLLFKVLHKNQVKHKLIYFHKMTIKKRFSMHDKSNLTVKIKTDLFY